MNETITNRKNLIISADDFGISPLANENILALAETGKLDRVAVMPYGSFATGEIEKLLASGVKLDLHLDCEQEIQKERKLKSGVITRSILFFIKYFFGKISAPVMELEWEKQLEKFYQLFGRYPDGLNSHQHIHFLPAYFKVMLRMAQKNNIRFVRFGKKGLIKSASKVYQILKWLRKKDANLFIASSLDSSDYVISLDWIKNMDKFLQHLPTGTTEVVCHPERAEEFKLMQKYF